MYSDNQSLNVQHRNSILFACKPKGDRDERLREIPREKARNAVQIDEHMHKRANVHKSHDFSYKWGAFLHSDH